MQRNDPVERYGDVAEDVSVSAGEPAAAAPLARRRVFLLAVGHMVVAVLAHVAYCQSDAPLLAYGAIVGLALGQASLLGIWGALGTDPWWVRLFGVAAGWSFLVILLNTVNSAIPIVMLVASLFVATSLLVVRCFRVSIRLDSLPVEPSRRIQFAIHDLMILTLAIACLVTIGKTVQPYLAHSRVSSALLLIALTVGAVGVLPVSFALAARQTVVHGFAYVALGSLAGYWLEWEFHLYDQHWMTATTTEAILVVVSLWSIRSWGYRLVRESPRPC